MSINSLFKENDYSIYAGNISLSNFPVADQNSTSFQLYSNGSGLIGRRNVANGFSAAKAVIQTINPNTSATIDTWVESYDVGPHFNNATGVYTPAPAAGDGQTYSVSATIIIVGAVGDIVTLSFGTSADPATLRSLSTSYTVVDGNPYTMTLSGKLKLANVGYIFTMSNVSVKPIPTATTIQIGSVVAGQANF